MRCHGAFCVFRELGWSVSGLVHYLTKGGVLNVIYYYSIEPVAAENNWPNTKFNIAVEQLSITSKSIKIEPQFKSHIERLLSTQ
jgi:hypothetical protein